MHCDPSTFPATVNVSTEGTVLSTLAGILAGFAFTAIVLLLVTGLDGASPAYRVLRASGRALVAAFVGLLIMSLLYAGEASTSVSCGLAISENTILSVGFVGVAILLFYAIVLMLEAAGASQERVPADSKGLAKLAQFGRVTVYVINVLILASVYDATSDYESIRYGIDSGMVALSWLGISVLALQVAACCWAVWVTMRSKRRGRFASSEPSSSVFLVLLGLGLPVVSCVAYVAVDTTESNTAVIAPAFAALILLIACASTITATIYLALTRPALTAQEGHSAGSVLRVLHSAGDQSPDTHAAPPARRITGFTPRFVAAVGTFASAVFIVHRILRRSDNRRDRNEAY